MRALSPIICLLFAAGYVLLAGHYPAVTWIQGTGMRFLWPLGVLVIAAAGFLWSARCRRGDPLPVGFAMIGLTGCLLLIPLAIARDQQAREDIERHARIVESRELLRQRQLQLEQIRKAAEADRRERAKSDRFVQYEGRIPDATLEQLRALDARMSSQVQEAANAYADALKANPTKGPESWIRFRSLDQLEAEWAAHKALYEQTRAFTQFIEGFEQQYTGEIAQLALQPPADRIAIAEMERVLQFWERSRIYELRQLDVLSLASALQALSILRDDWGMWSFNPRDNQLVFHDAARQAAFYQALQSLQQIAEEVRALSKDLPADS